MKTNEKTRKYESLPKNITNTLIKYDYDIVKMANAIIESAKYIGKINRENKKTVE